MHPVGERKMDNEGAPHILMVSYPVQSYLNPALQLASRLSAAGVLVTFATTVSAANRIIRSSSSDMSTPPAGLSFATFSDGYDDGFPQGSSSSSHLDTFKTRGSDTLSRLIATATPPFTGVVYTLILTWVAHVARHHRLPSALLWIQNATVFTIYYHYFNGYSELISACCDQNDPDWSVQLPSLPLLRAREVPTFNTPSTPYAAARQLLKEQFDELKEDVMILVNSFDSLESEAVEYLKQQRFRILTVGPLLAPPKSPSLTVDMFKRSEADYMGWLDSKASNSVVYVSFGSISELSREQMEEVAAGLVDSGRPFLWVIRGSGDDHEEEAWKRETGMVVRWCKQVEVLEHAAVGCFLSHCGWNSTMESVAAGVGVVGLPLWTDQLTNAKMLEEVWGNGLRVGLVRRDEIRRRLDDVMDDAGEVRRRATEWRDRAAEAVARGGSSQANFAAFVDELRRCWGTTPVNGEPDLRR